MGAELGAQIDIEQLRRQYALATDLIPVAADGKPAEAGKYLGLSNLATAGAGATSRCFGQ